MAAAAAAGSPPLAPASAWATRGSQNSISDPRKSQQNVAMTKFSEDCRDKNRQDSDQGQRAAPATMIGLAGPCRRRRRRPRQPSASRSCGDASGSRRDPRHLRRNRCRRRCRRQRRPRPRRPDQLRADGRSSVGGRRGRRHGPRRRGRRPPADIGCPISHGREDDDNQDRSQRLTAMTLGKTATKQRQEIYKSLYFHLNRRNPQGEIKMSPQQN